jgi:ABC-type nitrate/sulfonate/bicarbonate transport system permease component
MTLPLFAINTANALAKVDPQLAEALVSMGGGTLDHVRYLYLPSLVPTIQGNLTLGFGLALKVAILGEFMGAQDGLGHLLNVARVYFRMDEVFFYLFIVLAITLVVQIVQRLIFNIGFNRYVDALE